MAEETVLFLATSVASEEVFVVVCFGIALYAYVTGAYRTSLYFMIGCIATVVSVFSLKTLLKVARPPEPLIPIDGYGMPSGHATAIMFLAIACYVAFVTRMSPQVRTVYVVFSVFLVPAVGYSRVYYGVHTPLQVFAGYLLGIVVALGTAFLVYRFKHYRSPSHSSKNSSKNART